MRRTHSLAIEGYIAYIVGLSDNIEIKRENALSGEGIETCVLYTILKRGNHYH